LLSKSSVTRGVRFPLGMYQELEKKARANKETLNVFVVRLLQEKLNSASKDASVSYSEVG
jgi:hypothetical protein